MKLKQKIFGYANIVLGLFWIGLSVAKYLKNSKTYAYICFIFGMVYFVLGVGWLKHMRRIDNHGE